MSHQTDDTNSTVIEMDIDDSREEETTSSIDIVGGLLNPSNTAILYIEYQNDFVHPKGALYGAIESELKRLRCGQDMLSNSVNLLKKARAEGIHIVHAPITYCSDYEANANRYGVLYNVATKSAFEDKQWGADYHELMQPIANESIVKGKHGLDSFSGTNLDDILQQLGIANLVICGCLTNCCVESTMRTAYEFGYNVITLHDCCVAISQKEHENSVNHTFKMFSIPITSNEFMECITKSDVIDTLMGSKYKELPPSSVMHSRQKVEYLKMKSTVAESMISRLVNLVVLAQLLVTSMDYTLIDEVEIENERMEIMLLYAISIVDCTMTLFLFAICFYCYDRSKYENDDSWFPRRWRTYRVTTIKFMFRILSRSISVIAVCKLVVCVLFGVKRISNSKSNQQSVIISIIFTLVSGIFEIIYMVYESVNH